MRIAVFTTLLTICLITAAAAEPCLDVRAFSGNGFTLNPPRVERVGETYSVRGAVCRRAFAATPGRRVQADLIGADGKVIATRTARITGAFGYRGGCGHYALDGLAAGVARSLSVRLSAGS